MAKSKKVRKYIELRKQADKAMKKAREINARAHEAFDALSGAEVREYKNRLTEEHDGLSDVED